MTRGVLAVGWCAILSVLSAQAQPWFTDVTTNAGIHHLFTRPTNGLTTQIEREFYNMTGGAVAEDFNGDGWIDLYVLQGNTSTNLLYINQGNGTFSDQAASRGAAYVQNAVGAAAADYDNDGDVDLVFTVMTNFPILLVNTGSGHFAMVTLTNSQIVAYEDDFEGPIPDWGEINQYTSPSWGDINRDGRLDLVFGRWRGNSSDALFSYVQENGALIETPLMDENSENDYVFTPAFADMNGDGWPELLTVADYTNSHLYLNTRTGNVRRVTATAGTGTDQNGMGTAIGDYDNDGDLDWFITSIEDPLTNIVTAGKWGSTGNRLYRNDGQLKFSDVTTTAGVRDGNWGWGAAMGDLDNDGWLDIFHVNGWAEAFTTNYVIKFNDRPARLFRNRGDGTFTNIAAEAGVADTGQGRGTLLFDYDNDGDLDIFIVNNQVLTMVGTNAVRTPGPPRLYRNDGTNNYNWLKVTLAGTPPLHRDGIGSRVYLASGGMTQMRELNASSGYLAHGPNRIAHFGLGTNDVIDEVRAEWLTGDAVVRYDVAVDQAIALGSPQAAVSTNYFYGAGTVSVSATNVLPLGTPRVWVVNGVTNSDPLSVTLNQAGTHELTLHVYDLTGTNRVWTEIRRVQVETAELQLIHGVGPVWSIQWAARSGYVYQVQSANTPTSVWNSLTTPTTNVINDVISGVVTNPAPNALFRLLESPVP
jgi:hypothetical protein